MASDDAALRAHLDRHLVGGAADAARAHLDERLHVVERALEDRRARSSLARSPTEVERAVEDALGEALLAVVHHAC